LRIGLDYILIKDFFKVLEMNDIKYLSKYQRKNIVWDDLLSEYETLSGGRKTAKEVSVKGRVEGLKCQFNAIQLACNILSFRKEQTALDILKESYLHINESNYHQEIERVKKESESILIQIKKLESYLPEEKENTSPKQSQHIDQVILGYCSFVGIQIKPNKCTVTEFISLKNLFESKLKQLEKPQNNVK
jgi:hypothetical protein